jgi:tight adherence protein C
MHAETLRTERMQRAEEAARKSAVKMLFPTILFIFPVMLLVVLVPSILQIQRILAEVIK